MTNPTNDQPKPRGRPTPWQFMQFMLFAVPLGPLVGLFQSLCLHRPDQARLFWTEPLGVRMLAAVIALVLVGAAVYFGGCVLLNRSADRSRRGARALVAQGLLVAVWVFAFCAPAAFVLIVGPAAVQIQRDLRPG